MPTQGSGHFAREGECMECGEECRSGALFCISCLAGFDSEEAKVEAQLGRQPTLHDSDFDGWYDMAPETELVLALPARAKR